MIVATLEEIRVALDVARAKQAIVDGFVAYTRGKAVVPPVGELLFDDPPGDVHIKYGYLAGDAYFVIKVATGFYANPQLGLPANDGLLLVHECRTGRLVKILLDQGWLTAMRTALAGAIVAERLAPARVSRIGVLGTGEQARLQVMHLRGVVACQQVLLCGRSADSLRACARTLTAEGFEVRTTNNPDDLSACELIITATASTTPLLRVVRPGTHVTAVGTDAPNKNEVAAAVFRAADLVVADSISQCAQRGDLRAALAASAVARRDVVELGSLLAGAHRGRTRDEEITIADLTGVAVQDIKIAEVVMESLAGETS